MRLTSLSDDQTALIKNAMAMFSDGPGRRAVHLCLMDRAVTGLGVGAQVPMPVASIAKVAVVMAVLDRVAAGQLDGGARIDVSGLGATRYVSILSAFDPGASLSLREACRLAMITSDNPLAVYLGRLVDAADIAAVLRRVGASERSSITAGFSEAELGPANRLNVMTAEDVSAMMRAAVTEPQYDALRIGLENNLRNMRIPRLLPDEAVVAHKTGSLSGVVNDAGVVSLGDLRFVLSFLTDEQTDTFATEADIGKCAAIVLDALGR